MGDLARLARLGDYPGARAKPPVGEPAVDGRHRQQHGNRRVPVGEVFVAQNNHALSGPHRGLGGVANLFNRLPQGLLSARGGKFRRHALGLKILDLRREYARHVAVGEYRVRKLQQMRVRGELGQGVALVADVRHQAHDELLAYRVDRRVCHLREELLEVVVEQTGLFGEHREGRVVAHRAGGLARGLAHRAQDRIEVLGRISEELLALDEVFARDRLGHRLEYAAEGNAVGVHPPAVRLAARNERLYLLVEQNPVLLQVEAYHFARPEPAAHHDFRRRNVEHAGFGGEHELAAFGKREARGAQPVAVEERARVHAVREGYGGRAVPRLGEPRVVLEESLYVSAHAVISPPRLRHEHQHGVRKSAARGGVEFDGVVEAG